MALPDRHSPLPPAYPPAHTIKEVTAWATHLLNSYRPALQIEAPRPGERRQVAVADIRKVLREHVADPVHRRQFIAWCTAKANPGDRDLSFAMACKRNDWPEKSAERNIDKVLTALVLALNQEAEGRTD